jgi:acyl-coenzyme A thioesterase PaaI-like protein
MKASGSIKASTLRRLINLWPPFLFNAIAATYMSDDYKCVKVSLALRWYNRNYVGTHFGGNLFAMTDPWFMLMLLENLGRDYFVWDKRASIDFIAPGKGTVTAQFVLEEAMLNLIRDKTKTGEKYLPEFVVDILDENNQVVARVNKVVYVKRKPLKLNAAD